MKYDVWFRAETGDVVKTIVEAATPIEAATKGVAKFGFDANAGIITALRVKRTDDPKQIPGDER